MELRTAGEMMIQTSPWRIMGNVLIHVIRDWTVRTKWTSSGSAGVHLLLQTDHTSVRVGRYFTEVQTEPT
ncbi:hypothetical protein FQA47_015511 [Oryzias melastigma]|uniref:Uncharacterized protein n=1 Tax=Oryzias melastigma TaxID=30732 RepID=A0A834FQJ3_ORYME|nr:hypothetical protein FQA47_015511 [Oryzias melastigma]